MTIQILFFGIASELVGANSIVYALEKNITVKELKNSLKLKFNNLNNIEEFAIAVNESYATDDVVVFENNVVAIIPPVSGG